MNTTVLYTGLGKISFDTSRMALLKILGILILPVFGGIFHTACYLVVTAWCLLSVRRALEGLILLWLLTFLNPGIYSLSSLEGALRWLPLFASTFTMLRIVVFSREFKIPRTVGWLTVYALGVMILAIIGSRVPLVSIFKVMSFYIGSATILIGFQVQKEKFRYWESWFKTLLKAILLLSLPLIIMDWGYTRNGTGFQGVLNHPQTFGPVIGLLLSWFFANGISNKNHTVWSWFILGIGVISIIATESRTALLVFIGGIGIAGFFSLYRDQRILRWLNLKKLAVVIPLIGIGILVGIANSSTIIGAVQDFVLKRNDNVSLEQSFQKSRGFLIDQSMQNFTEHPVVGIGFGISSVPSEEMSISRDPVFGLPIGASVEKGFLPSAILEETGILGMALFVILLGSVLRPIIAKKVWFPSLVLITGALLMNLGEATLLSMGGNGLLLWLLIGFASIHSYK